MQNLQPLLILAAALPIWAAEDPNEIIKRYIAADGKNWEQLTFGADMQHDASYSPDGSMILFCRAPSAEGPWQICVKKLDSEDDADFVPITKDGSNLQPDWHSDGD